MLDMEYTAIAALYDNTTNALLEVHPISITKESVIGYTNFSNFAGSGEDLDAKLVVFCWDSIDGIKPLWNVPLTARTKEQ